jgi:S1-C subfamily serine protease
MNRYSRAIALSLLVTTAVTRASSQSATTVSSPEWARTLEQISRGVVSIQFDLARSFDTETNASLQATGFVVDAKRGLILTNRHVVTTGPVTAKGIFLDREEVQLYPVYRDPVHDFGFYRYDPLQLRFIAPEEIALYPSGARIGTDIRVVGNDAGERRPDGNAVKGDGPLWPLTWPKWCPGPESNRRPSA